MKSTLYCLLIFLMALLLGAHDSSAEPNDQPHMRKALVHLEAAKVAGNPIPELKAARQQLGKATGNKKGEKVDAIQFIQEAIAFHKAGDKEAFNYRLAKAISNVKSGIARAGR